MKKGVKRDLSYLAIFLLALVVFFGGVLLAGLSEGRPHLFYTGVALVVAGSALVLYGVHRRLSQVIGNKSEVPETPEDSYLSGKAVLIIVAVAAALLLGAAVWYLLSSA